MIRVISQPPRPIKLDVSLAIVNIVLLLILFFLATGQLLNPRTGDLNLAETQDIPLEALPSPILVVTDTGSWELDGAVVVPDLLGVALADIKSQTLHVLISQEAPAASLLEVLNNPGTEGVELKLVTLRMRQAQR